MTCQTPHPLGNNIENEKFLVQKENLLVQDNGMAVF